MDHHLQQWRAERRRVAHRGDVKPSNQSKYCKPKSAIEASDLINDTTTSCGATLHHRLLHHDWLSPFLCEKKKDHQATREISVRCESSSLFSDFHRVPSGLLNDFMKCYSETKARSHGPEGQRRYAYGNPKERGPPNFRESSGGTRCCITEFGSTCPTGTKFTGDKVTRFGSTEPTSRLGL